MRLYLIGSLRNPAVPQLGKKLREAGYTVFDDWFAAGPEADDYWQKYETERGHTYAEAIKGFAAGNVFEFDREHLNRAEVGILIMPAGKSGHIELGYLIGQGKPSFVLFDQETLAGKLPESWRWLCGLWEGEGSLTRNGKRTGHGMQLTITMKDEDIIRRATQVAGVGTIEGPYIRNNPQWSPMWRWAVRKRQDILYVVRGLWGELGIRRKEQILRVCGAAGITETEIFDGPGPKHFRYDVMYRFASGIFFNEDDLFAALQTVASLRRGKKLIEDQMKEGGSFEPNSSGRRGDGWSRPLSTLDPDARRDDLGAGRTP